MSLSRSWVRLRRRSVADSKGNQRLFRLLSKPSVVVVVVVAVPLRSDSKFPGWKSLERRKRG